MALIKQLRAGLRSRLRNAVWGTRLPLSILVSMRFAGLTGALLTLACSEIPQDQAGTIDRIRASGQLRVGLVSGTRAPERALSLLRKLGQRENARLVTSAQPATFALKALEDGKLDVVVGEFGRTDPVSQEVSLSEAVGDPEPRDGKEPALRLVRKNGENELITRTDILVLR